MHRIILSNFLQSFYLFIFLVISPYLSEVIWLSCLVPETQNEVVFNITPAITVFVNTSIKKNYFAARVWDSCFIPATEPYDVCIRSTTSSDEILWSFAKRNIIQGIVAHRGHTTRKLLLRSFRFPAKQNPAAFLHFHVLYLNYILRAQRSFLYIYKRGCLFKAKKILGAWEY